MGQRQLSIIWGDPSDAGSPRDVGFLAQVVVNHHDGACEGAEEDAGHEREWSNDHEGDVVLGRQWGLLTLPEGLIPKGHDRIFVQLLRDSAEEQALLWKRKSVSMGTLGHWAKAGVMDRGDVWDQGRRTGIRLIRIAQSGIQRRAVRVQGSSVPCALGSGMRWGGGLEKFWSRW